MYLNFKKQLSFFRNVKLEDTYFDRDVETKVVTNSKKIFETKTKPSLFIANQVGNMYTPSVYGGLVSYLIRYFFKSTPTNFDFNF